MLYVEIMSKVNYNIKCKYLCGEGTFSFRMMRYNRRRSAFNYAPNVIKNLKTMISDSSVFLSSI